MQAHGLQDWVKPRCTCRVDVIAAWPVILKLIFSYEGTSEDLQEPDISDTTDLLLSDPEFTEVQLDLHPSCRGRLLPAGLLLLKRNSVGLLLVGVCTKNHF